jgi:hypothetical protein
MHFYETVGTRIPVLLENDDMMYEFLEFERGGEIHIVGPNAHPGLYI